MQKISATDLARNTRDILDRVTTSGEAIAIERNHTIIVQIAPPQRTMTAAQALVGLDRRIAPVHAQAWLQESREAFDNALRDPWGVILDSCIWLGVAAGQIDRAAVIEATANEPVFVSAVSLSELRLGVEICTDPAERALRAANLRQIEMRPTLSITKNTAAAFGVLAAAVKQSGRSPRPRYNDLWIAAQAIENSHALLTTNLADFLGLPGLRLIQGPGEGSRAKTPV